MPKIFDNIENSLNQGLKDTLQVSNRSDFCVGYFNLRGWKEVADDIDCFGGTGENCCRLLIGMHKTPLDLLKEHFSKIDKGILDLKEANRIKKQLAQEFKDQLTIGIPTESDEKGLRKLSAQIKSGKVKVKLFLKHTLHAKLYLCFRNDKINPVIGYLGSSNLTFAGLSRQGELNIDVLDQDAACKLAKWFNDRWDDRWCIDISDELVDIIDNSWAADRLYSPYHIYLKIAYHLSREARTGINEFKIPKVFKNELLEFQEKAVLIAAHHLHKRDGVMIGDVVGLGKTIVASAIAKIFEDDFFLETLIICPKNLKKMWEFYKHKYGLRAEILPITETQSKLPDMRRYRVVIIDESHNLRNREGRRYRAIKEYLGINASKVILVTATPYNKTYLDLSSQLRLFIDEDTDLGIGPENYIESIGGKVQFSAKHQANPRSLVAFEKSDFIDDWRELMRLFLVRRTRSFIKQYYAQPDINNNNRRYLTFADGTKSYFPDRIPKRASFGYDKKDPDDQYAKLYSDDVVSKLDLLNLPRYGLANYLDDRTKLKATSDEEIIKENLSRAGKRLMGFARTNLFKRLESSGYAFLLSIIRHVIRNYIYIYALQNDLPLPVGTQEVNALNEFLDDADIENPSEPGSKLNLLLESGDYLNLAKEIYITFERYDKKKYDWIRSGLFNKSLLTAIINDSNILVSVLKLSKQWDPQKDRKLKAFIKLIKDKHPNEKVLLFTQYADTAKYLISELKNRKIDGVESVTGDSDDPTAVAYRFSPVSNEQKGIKNTSSEIRVLISTDVLSEGQNLQDCHIVVNFDLPWALIRLIQRTGRIDRIGQKAEEIICYSFLPEDGVNEIIRLRERLTRRITENAEVIGSDEIFFEGDPVNIQDLYNEKAGIFDEEEDGEIDLSSYAFQIWKDAVDKDPELQKIIPDLPNVVYATKGLSRDNDQGVIVYAKTYDDNDLLALVNNEGEIVTQSQLRILKAAECEPETKALTKLEKHHVLVEKGIAHIKDMDSVVGGQLGKKTSARFRVYMHLYGYYNANKDTLFVNDTLKRTIEEIYNNPLKEFAKETFNRQLKSGIDDQELAQLAVSLREEDKLCLLSDEETIIKDPLIICSMGLKHVE